MTLFLVTAAKEGFLQRLTALRQSCSARKPSLTNQKPAVPACLNHNPSPEKSQKHAAGLTRPASCLFFVTPCHFLRLRSFPAISFRHAFLDTTLRHLDFWATFISSHTSSLDDAMIARSSSPSSIYPAVRRGLVRRPTPLRRRPLSQATTSPSSTTICTRCMQTKATFSRPTPSRPATTYSSVPALTRARTGQQRHNASIATATEENTVKPTHDDFGPLQEYDRRVDAGRLRNDEHQRGRSHLTRTTDKSTY